VALIILRIEQTFDCYFKRLRDLSSVDFHAKHYVLCARKSRESFVCQWRCFRSALKLLWW